MTPEASLSGFSPDNPPNDDEQRWAAAALRLVLALGTLLGQLRLEPCVRRGVRKCQAAARVDLTYHDITLVQGDNEIL